MTDRCPNPKCRSEFRYWRTYFSAGRWNWCNHAWHHPDPPLTLFEEER